MKVIDLYGLKANEVRDQFPDVYTHVVDEVRPHREARRGASKDADEYAGNWWLFGKVRTELREFTTDLPRYIVTIETTKHRVFRFLGASVRPDNMLVAIGLDHADALAVLSSRLHVAWSLSMGGTLEDRPRYNKTRTFDPFPFPTVLCIQNNPPPATYGESSSRYTSRDQAVLDRLRELGERLEAHRREQLDTHDDLTMTGLYNRLERRRIALVGSELLTDDERHDHERARTAILAEIHDDIDRAVLEAYGWSDLAPALVGRPGGTVPSEHKFEEQVAAEDVLLTRLVELNRERAAEEARGQVRWLRPDYQIPKLGSKVPQPEAEQGEMDTAVVIAPEGLTWPSNARDQFGAIRELLDEADEPLPPEAVARAFKGRVSAKRRERVDEVLAIMADLGTIRSGDREGQRLYFARR